MERFVIHFDLEVEERDFNAALQQAEDLREACERAVGHPVELENIERTCTPPPADRRLARHPR